jgi:hypothetical protein
LAYPWSANAAAKATEGQLKEMTAAFERFVSAVAARDGRQAVDLVSHQFLDGYVAARDKALKASEVELRKEFRSVPVVMALRINFTADELERKSAREIYAAWVQKGLAGTKEAAHFLSGAQVTDAFLQNEPDSMYAQATIVLKRGDKIDGGEVFVYERDGWRLNDPPGLLGLSEYSPACLWRAAAVGQKPDAACTEEMKAAERPLDEYITAAMKGGGAADEEFDRLHQPEAFAALMRHPYDPQYWQPMRTVAVH